MAFLHGIYQTIGSLCSRVDRFAIERQLRLRGVGHATRIPTHTTRVELHTLFFLARSCPPNANVLEIGSYLGASTCYITTGIAQHGGMVFCVDTWSNETMVEGLRDTFVEFLANTSPVSSWLHAIRKRSDQLVENDLVTPLDFVFIDGDHSYKAVRADFERAERWLSPNGVIAFHDSRYFPGVSRVVGEALASSHWILGGCAENLCWINRVPQSWTTIETIGIIEE